jgi:hypothetical protein
MGGVAVEPPADVDDRRVVRFEPQAVEWVKVRRVSVRG